MCRYAMTSYKPHYACFTCRKTYKRRLLSDINREYGNEESPAKCPECSAVMADMGLDFKSPPKKNIKLWNHLSTLYKVGITFHSCGCNGPGYIPNTSEELIEYFSRIREIYLKHQYFWSRRREDPKTQSDIDRDRQKNINFLYRIPKEMKKGTRKKPKYDAVKAQQYWNDKVLEIEEKIKTIG